MQCPCFAQVLLAAMMALLVCTAATDAVGCAGVMQLECDANNGLVHVSLGLGALGARCIAIHNPLANCVVSLASYHAVYNGTIDAAPLILVNASVDNVSIVLTNVSLLSDGASTPATWNGAIAIHGRADHTTRGVNNLRLLMNNCVLEIGSGASSASGSSGAEAAVVRISDVGGGLQNVSLVLSDCVVTIGNAAQFFYLNGTNATNVSLRMQDTTMDSTSAWPLVGFGSAMASAAIGTWLEFTEWVVVRCVLTLQNQIALLNVGSGVSVLAFAVSMEASNATLVYVVPNSSTALTVSAQVFAFHVGNRCIMGQHSDWRGSGGGSVGCQAAVSLQLLNTQLTVNATYSPSVLQVPLAYQFAILSHLQPIAVADGASAVGFVNGTSVSVTDSRLLLVGPNVLQILGNGLNVSNVRAVLSNSTLVATTAPQSGLNSLVLCVSCATLVDVVIQAVWLRLASPTLASMLFCLSTPVVLGVRIGVDNTSIDATAPTVNNRMVFVFGGASVGRLLNIAITVRACALRMSDFDTAGVVYAESYGINAQVAVRVEDAAVDATAYTTDPIRFFRALEANRVQFSNVSVEVVNMRVIGGIVNSSASNGLMLAGLTMAQGGSSISNVLVSVVGCNVPVQGAALTTGSVTHLTMVIEDVAAEDTTTAFAAYRSSILAITPPILSDVFVRDVSITIRNASMAVAGSVISLTCSGLCANVTITLQDSTLYMIDNASAMFDLVTALSPNSAINSLYIATNRCVIQDRQPLTNAKLIRVLVSTGSGIAIDLLATRCIYNGTSTSVASLVNVGLLSGRGVLERVSIAVTNCTIEMQSLMGSVILIGAATTAVTSPGSARDLRIVLQQTTVVVAGDNVSVLGLLNMMYTSDVVVDVIHSTWYATPRIPTASSAPQQLIWFLVPPPGGALSNVSLRVVHTHMHLGGGLVAGIRISGGSVSTSNATNVVVQSIASNWSTSGVAPPIVALTAFRYVKGLVVAVDGGVQARNQTATLSPSSTGAECTGVVSIEAVRNVDNASIVFQGLLVDDASDSGRQPTLFLVRDVLLVTLLALSVSNVQMEAVGDTGALAEGSGHSGVLWHLVSSTMTNCTLVVANTTLHRLVASSVTSAHLTSWINCSLLLERLTVHCYTALDRANQSLHVFSNTTLTSTVLMQRRSTVHHIADIANASACVDVRGIWLLDCTTNGLRCTFEGSGEGDSGATTSTGGLLTLRISRRKEDQTNVTGLAYTIVGALPASRCASIDNGRPAFRPLVTVDAPGSAAPPNVRQLAVSVLNASAWWPSMTMLYINASTRWPMCTLGCEFTVANSTVVVSGTASQQQQNLWPIVVPIVQIDGSHFAAAVLLCYLHDALLVVDGTRSTSAGLERYPLYYVGLGDDIASLHMDLLRTRGVLDGSSQILLMATHPTGPIRVAVVDVNLTFTLSLIQLAAGGTPLRFLNITCLRSHFTSLEATTAMLHLDDLSTIESSDARHVVALHACDIVFVDQGAYTDLARFTLLISFATIVDADVVLSGVTIGTRASSSTRPMAFRRQQLMTYLGHGLRMSIHIEDVVMRDDGANDGVATAHGVPAIGAFGGQLLVSSSLRLRNISVWCPIGDDYILRFSGTTIMNTAIVVEDIALHNATASVPWITMEQLTVSFPNARESPCTVSDSAIWMDRFTILGASPGASREASLVFVGLALIKSDVSSSAILVGSALLMPCWMGWVALDVNRSLMHNTVINVSATTRSNVPPQLLIRNSLTNLTAVVVAWWRASLMEDGHRCGSPPSTPTVTTFLSISDVDSVQGLTVVTEGCRLGNTSNVQVLSIRATTGTVTNVSVSMHATSAVAYMHHPILHLQGVRFADVEVVAVDCAFGISGAARPASSTAMFADVDAATADRLQISMVNVLCGGNDSADLSSGIVMLSGALANHTDFVLTAIDVRSSGNALGPLLLAQGATLIGGSILILNSAAADPPSMTTMIAYASLVPQSLLVLGNLDGGTRVALQNLNIHHTCAASGDTNNRNNSWFAVVRILGNMSGGSTVRIENTNTTSVGGGPEHCATTLLAFGDGTTTTTSNARLTTISDSSVEIASTRVTVLASRSAPSGRTSVVPSCVALGPYGIVVRRVAFRFSNLTLSVEAMGGGVLPLIGTVGAVTAPDPLLPLFDNASVLVDGASQLPSSQLVHALWGTFNDVLVSVSEGSFVNTTAANDTQPTCLVCLPPTRWGYLDVVLASGAVVVASTIVGHVSLMVGEAPPRTYLAGTSTWRVHDALYYGQLLAFAPGSVSGTIVLRVTNSSVVAVARGGTLIPHAPVARDSVDLQWAIEGTRFAGFDVLLGPTDNASCATDIALRCGNRWLQHASQGGGGASVARAGLPLTFLQIVPGPRVHVIETCVRWTASGTASTSDTALGTQSMTLVPVIAEAVPTGAGLVVVVATNGAVVAASLPLGTLMGPAGGMWMQRSVLQMQLAACELSLDEPVDVATSPTQLAFGPSEGASIRGAVVGNMLLLVAIALAALLLTFARIRIGPRGSSSADHRRDHEAQDSNAHRSMTLRCAGGMLSLPGWLLVPFGLLMQPIAASATTLVVHRSGDARDLVVAVVGWLVCVAPLVYCFDVVFRRFRATSVPVDDDDADAFDESQRVLASWPLGKWMVRCSHWLFWRDHKWAPTPGNPHFVDCYSVLFDGYRSGREWYGLVEFSVTLIYGVIGGVMPEDSDQCVALLAVLSVLNIVTLVLFAILRPFELRVEACVAAINYVCGAVWGPLILGDQQEAAEVFALAQVWLQVLLLGLLVLRMVLNGAASKGLRLCRKAGQAFVRGTEFVYGSASRLRRFENASVPARRKIQVPLSTAIAHDKRNMRRSTAPPPSVVAPSVLLANENPRYRAALALLQTMRAPRSLAEQRAALKLVLSIAAIGAKGHHARSGQQQQQRPTRTLAARLVI